MSNLRTLYTNLAAVPVAFNTEAGAAKSITALDLPNAPKAVETASLPLRVLLPTVEWSSDGQSMEYISMGGSTASGNIVWGVTDLLLWEAVGQTRGLPDMLPDLVRYAGAYASALLPQRNLAANIRLVSLGIRPGTFEYPLGSGRGFFGVECLLSFTELLNP